MAKRWPYLVPLAVIAILFAIFGKRLVDVEQGFNPAMIPSVLNGKPMPEFDLPGLPGRTNDRGFKTADLKGQVSLVNVWGSWCVGCLQEHPNLVKLTQGSGIPVHGIAWRDKPEASLAWLRKQGDPYTLVGQDPDSRTAIALGITGAPETFLVDPYGRSVFKWANQITPEVWQKEFLPRIAQLRK